MTFPNRKKLTKIHKKLEQEPGFLMLSPNASELDKMRFSISQELLKYAQKKNLKAVEMASFLGITKADMSRIYNHRIDKFSTDKLLQLYEKIKPNYKLKVS